MISDFKLSDSDLIQGICLGPNEEYTESDILEKLKRKNYKNVHGIKIKRSNVKEEVIA